MVFLMRRFDLLCCSRSFTTLLLRKHCATVMSKLFHTPCCFPMFVDRNCDKPSKIGFIPTDQLQYPTPTVRELKNNCLDGTSQRVYLIRVWYPIIKKRNDAHTQQGVGVSTYVHESQYPKESLVDASMMSSDIYMKVQCLCCRISCWFVLRCQGHVDVTVPIGDNVNMGWIQYLDDSSRQGRVRFIDDLVDEWIIGVCFRWHERGHIASK